MLTSKVDIVSGVIPLVKNVGVLPDISACHVFPITTFTTTNVFPTHALGQLSSLFLHKGCVNPANSDASTVLHHSFAISALQVTTSIKAGATSTVLETFCLSTKDTTYNF